MSLIEKEIDELRALNAKLQEGEITKEDALASVAIYSQTEKRMNLLLRAYIVEAKYGRSAPSLLIEAKKAPKALEAKEG